MELKDCPERITTSGGHGCKIVQNLSDKPLELCTVGEDACRFCCQQKDRPTEGNPNVVVTSTLIHTARKSGDEGLQKMAHRLHAKTQQGLLGKAGEYLRARDYWKKAGKPMRSDEKIREIFSICSKGCENYLPGGDGGGQCGICGCWLYPIVTQVNKIQWATEKCPLLPPKWDAEVGGGGVEGCNGKTIQDNGIPNFYEHLKNRGKLRLIVSGVKPLNKKELLRLNTVWVVQESMRDEKRGILVLDARVVPPVGGIVLLQLVAKKVPSGNALIQAGFIGALEIKFRLQQALEGRKFLLSVHKDDSVKDFDLSRASIRVEIL